MRNKLFKFTVTLTSIFIVLLFAMTFLLKNIGMYGTAIEEKINALLRNSIPITLHFEKISGNPFTGFNISPLILRHNDREIFTASELNLHLSLLNLLRGTIKVTSLHLYDVSGDFTAIMDALPASDKKSESTRLPVDKIRITRGQMTTPLSPLSIDTLTLTNTKQGTAANFKGGFKSKKLELAGKFIETKPSESTLKINWGESTARLSGNIIHLKPNEQLTLLAQKLDLSAFAIFFPALVNISPSGEGEGEFFIHNTPSSGISAAGEGRIIKGGIFGIPLKKGVMEIAYSRRFLTFAISEGWAWESPLSGDFSFSFPTNAPLSLDIKARAGNVALKEILSLFSSDIKPSPIVADAVDIELQGPLKKINGNLQAKAKNLKLNDGVALQDVTLTSSVRESEQLSLLFLGKLSQAPIQISGDISIATSIGRLAGSIQNLPLDAIFSIAKKENTHDLQGNVSSQFSLAGNITHPTLAGNIHIPELRAKAIAIPAKEIRANVESDLVNLKIDNLHALWGGAPLSISGTIQNVTTEPILDIAATLSSLHLTSLVPLFPALKQNQLGGVLNASANLTGTLNTPSVVFSGEINGIQRLGAHTSPGALSFSGATDLKEILFKNLMLSASGKTFSAGGRVVLPREGHPLLAEFKGDFRDFPLETIAHLNLISEDIRGVATGSVKVEMNHEKGLGLSLRLDNARLGIRHLLLTNLGGGLAYSGGTLSIKELTAQLGKGTILLDGTVSGVQQDQPEFDLNLATKSLDLGRSIRLILPEMTGIQGLVTSKLNITGTPKQPSLAGKVSIFRLFTRGLFLPQTTMGLKATPREVKINSIQSVLGNGKLEAEALFEKKDTGWVATISAFGKKLNMRILSSYLAAETRRQIEGAVDFSFKGSGLISNFKGKGLLTTDKISIRGATFTHVKAPFNIQDSYLTIEESTAGFYRGKVKAQLAADMASTRWGGRVAILSADTAGFMRDTLPDLSGSISGMSTLSLQITGDTRRTSLLDVKGRLDVAEGEITGFDGLTTLSKAMNKAPLSFQSISSNFVIDGQNLYILPGSRATAPVDHPAYRYVLIDGDANMQSGVSLSFIGNVNLRALNIFFNALTGVLSSGLANITNTQNILSELLGGAVRGFSSSEFRDVSFNLSGKPGNFVFTDFAVAPIPSVNFRPSLLDDHSQATAIKEQKISITVEIPIGRDLSGRGKNIKKQVEGQLIEQILHGIIGTSE